MVIQLADEKGQQIRALLDAELDAELNAGGMDFELVVDANTDTDIKEGYRIFIEGTEIGGFLGNVVSNTASEKITWNGYTWRGMMAHKIILPPPGQDHYEVNGELNTILRELVNSQFDGVIKAKNIDTGVNVKFKFDRFCTLLDGITKMLKSVNYRLEIKYNVGKPNGSGWVDIEAVPVKDWSNEIELSQDSKLNFTITKKSNGVNHLVVGGKDDLQDRTVLHLYVQKDGSIGKTQYYKGIQEITEFYENTSTDTADLENKAKEKLQSLMSTETFEMDVERLGIDIQIGDIIGGRDYRTGITLRKPLENIVVVISNGTIKKEYKLEGEKT